MDPRETAKALSKRKEMNPRETGELIVRRKSIAPKEKAETPRVPIFSMAPVPASGNAGNEEGVSGVRKSKHEEMTSTEGLRPKIPKPTSTSAEKKPTTASTSAAEKVPSTSAEKEPTTASTPAAEQQEARGPIFKPRVEGWDLRTLVPAIKDGRVLLLENLVPGLHSDDLRDALNEELNFKSDVLINPPESPFFNTTSALLRVKSSATAKKVHEAMNSKNLVVNGRLVTTSQLNYNDFKPPPSAKSIGHIQFDKEVRDYTNEDFREAVATSHIAQGNTIEYDFGREWRLVDAQHEEQWRMLEEHYKQRARKNVASASASASASEKKK